jgi:4-amino-4-deoxy-L-arabinose transferase-like glycosyltransferase
MAESAFDAPRPAPAVLIAMVRRPYAALLLLCLVAWLPGLTTLPALDRDEARFAQASKQMVETGNWVDIRFGNEARYKKPVGIYWLQAAATEILGQPPYNAIWTYRIPSLAGAIVAVFLAFWCFSALAPPLAAWLGAGLLALALGLAAEAHIAKTDAVLLAAVLGAEGVLLRFYLAARDAARAKPGLALAMAGWMAMAVGVLVKGPVILAVLGLTAIAVSIWDRDWRWLASLHPARGIALLLLLVLPWLVTIGIATHGAFFEQSLGGDFAGKLVGGAESHGAPPGYYIVLSTLTLWPVTLFALPGLGAAVARRTEPGFRFLLGWAGANWLMFALVPTKLPHYILPAYPALAIMAALWITRGRVDDETGGARVLRYLAALQFALGSSALAAAVVLAPDRYGAGAPVWLIALAALVAAAGVAGAVLLLLRKPMPALLAAGFAALVLYPVLMWAVAPRLNEIWISPRLQALVAKDSQPGDPAPVTAGYDEPSLIFLLGTRTRIATGAEAADIAAGQGGLALVDDRQRPAFLNRLVEIGAYATPVDQLSGINYSHGKPVHIIIYRVRAQPRAASNAIPRIEAMIRSRE